MVVEEVVIAELDRTGALPLKSKSESTMVPRRGGFGKFVELLLAVKEDDMDEVLMEWWLGYWWCMAGLVTNSTLLCQLFKITDEG